MPNKSGIHIGSIVHLNSGSPDLKVVAANGDLVSVEWLNERGNWERLSDRPAVCFRGVK